MAHPRSRAVIARLRHIASLGAGGSTPVVGSPYTQIDVATLQTNVVGSVVAPWTPGYDADRMLADTAYNPWPILIVYCEVFNDVWQSLAFAHKFNLHALCRSGGHSTAGFSSQDGTMVIDLSRINYVAVDPVTRTARVGAGTQLGQLNAMLDGYKLHTPGGSCPDVAVAGHMMGGGFGYTSREFGMNCDAVLEVLVMLADGRIVRANADVNPDLYWAICGGTGNNFGVLLEITYKLFDLWDVWGWGMSYPIKHAPEALVAIQRDYMMDAAPATLGYQVSFITNAGEKRLVLRGTFHGKETDGKKLIAPLLKLPGATNEVDTVNTYYLLNEGLVNSPYVFPNIPANASEDKISGYCARLLEKSEWASVCGAASQDKQGYAFANLEVMGCAIKARPMHSSAYIHRDSYFDWAQDTFWTTDAEKADAYRFMDGMIKAWTPLLNGHANQDYPRRSQTDYRWLFFGNAFNTLLFVKNKYDPKNFFHYQQSISPYPSGEAPRDLPSSLFSDTAIVEEPYSRRITG